MNALPKSTTKDFFNKDNGKSILEGGVFNKSCSQISTSLSNNEICDHDIAESWSSFVQKEFISDYSNQCLRACQIKEYKIVHERNGIHGQFEWQNEFCQSGHFQVEFKFEMPPNKESMSKKPYKTVKTEYWVMPFSSLVGNVGGTLGMFWGFSFYIISKWMMEKAVQIKLVIASLMDPAM